MPLLRAPGLAGLTPVGVVSWQHQPSNVAALPPTPVCAIKDALLRVDAEHIGHPTPIHEHTCVQRGILACRDAGLSNCRCYHEPLVRPQKPQEACDRPG